MTAAEIQTRLDLVNAAINSILTGKAQSVSIAGRAYTALDLSKLEEIRRGLEVELAQVTAGSVRPIVVRFVRPGGG